MNDYDRWRLTNDWRKLDDVPTFEPTASAKELLAEGNELYSQGDVVAARASWVLALDKAIREQNDEVKKQAETYLASTVSEV